MYEACLSHGVRGRRQALGTGRRASGRTRWLAIVAVVVLAVAILGAALLLRPKDEAPAVDPREVACIEAGGMWNETFCFRP